MENKDILKGAFHTHSEETLKPYECEKCGKQRNKLGCFVCESHTAKKGLFSGTSWSADFIEPFAGIPKDNETKD